MTGVQKPPSTSRSHALSSARVPDPSARGRIFEQIFCERRRLPSYSGVSEQTALVFEPASLEELRALFAAAKQLAVRCTLRGGGWSFHDQAQGGGWVIDTRRMNRFEIRADEAELVAEPGALWGDVVAQAERVGLVPWTCVTTSQATVGGTLSGGCLSRFSPTSGKEGRHVKRFTLLTIEGELIECRPPEHPNPRRWSLGERAFAAAIGGLGAVGCIVEAVIGLRRVVGRGAPVAVWTRVSKLGDGSKLAPRLLPREGGPSALTAVLFPPSTRRMGLYFESEYTSTNVRRRMLVHQPDMWLRTALEWGMRVPKLSATLWSVIYRCFREQTEFLDDVAGFLFFMDGNVRAKALALQAGIDVFTVQQTFVLPALGSPPDEAELERAIDAFMADAEVEFTRQGVAPTVIDLMYLPSESYSYLSPTFGRAGVAVSFAFEVQRAQVEKVARAFTNVSDVCDRAGGRTYLVKNVFARSETLRAMYAEGLPELERVRAELDPDGLLGNDLFARFGIGERMSAKSGTHRRVQLDEAPASHRRPSSVPAVGRR